MNWEVGDVAIFIMPGSPMEGKEVTILTPAYPRPEATDLVHHVDPGFPAPEEDAVWGVERRHLRPLPSPRDPSTWKDCVFKPGELVS